MYDSHYFKQELIEHGPVDLLISDRKKLAEALEPFIDDLTSHMVKNHAQAVNGLTNSLVNFRMFNNKRLSQNQIIKILSLQFKNDSILNGIFGSNASKQDSNSLINIVLANIGRQFNPQDYNNPTILVLSLAELSINPFIDLLLSKQDEEAFKFVQDLNIEDLHTLVNKFKIEHSDKNMSPCANNFLGFIFKYRLDLLNIIPQRLGLSGVRLFYPPEPKNKTTNSALYVHNQEYFTKNILSKTTDSMQNTEELIRACDFGDEDGESILLDLIFEYGLLKSCFEMNRSDIMKLLIQNISTDTLCASLLYYGFLHQLAKISFSQQNIEMLSILLENLNSNQQAALFTQLKPASTNKLALVNCLECAHRQIFADNRSYIETLSRWGVQRRCFDRSKAKITSPNSSSEDYDELQSAFKALSLDKTPCSKAQLRQHHKNLFFKYNENLGEGYKQFAQVNLAKDLVEEHMASKEASGLTP